jgi:hypothetical protein
MLLPFHSAPGGASVDIVISQGVTATVTSLASVPHSSSKAQSVTLARAIARRQARPGRVVNLNASVKVSLDR